MKLLIVILNVFLFSNAVAAKCQFVDKTKVFSLSGPVTVALKKLGLLNDPALHGISTFHPVKKNEFHGLFLSGGIQMSHKELSKMREAVVFYDQSASLKKLFNHFKINAIEIVTRNLSPKEVSQLIVYKIGKFLEGCQKEIISFFKLTDEISSEILKLIPKHFHGVFFMGSFKKTKFPDLVIANDGVVKWLIQEKKIISYPTKFAYVPWSMKLLDSLSPQTFFIGVDDSSQNFQSNLEFLGNNTINFKYPGALIPGISQLEAWRFLFKNFLRTKSLLNV